MIYQKIRSSRVILLLIILSSLVNSTFAQSENDFEVNTISFEGNNSFSSTQLKSVLVVKESPSWFSQFFNSFSPFGEEAIYFDSLSLPTDISLLNSFYRINGFFECEVEYDFVIDKDSKNVDLIFKIKEGSAYYFRDYHRTGLDNVIQNVVNVALNEYVADTTMKYSEQFVQSDINYVTNYMRDRGYMFFNFDIPQILVDTVNNRVDVNINFIPGEFYKVSDIYVEKDGPGKDLVEDELIRNVAGITPQDNYSDYELKSAQVRLYRTNLFSSAQVNPVVEDTISNRVPLVINTTIGLMNEFIPELILNNEDNVLNIGFSLGYSRKNFLGDARRLTIQTSLASQDIFWFLSNPSVTVANVNGYVDARIILEQPFLFGNLINTKLEVYNTLQKRKENYNQYLVGSGLSLDFNLPQKVYITSFITYLNWEYERTKLFDEYLETLYGTYIDRKYPDIGEEERKDSIKVMVDNTPQESKNYSTSNTIFGINVGVNKTNSILFPTRGFRVNSIIENGNGFPYLFSKIFNQNFDNPLYYKVILNTSYFLPIYDKSQHATGTKFVVGNMQTYKGNKFDIPINQRFTAGGSNSIRGWGNRELVPQENEVPKIIDEGRPTEELEALFLRNTLPGGFFWLEGSFETRNRIWEDIGGALFLDYGNVWNKTSDFRWDGIALAAGFGLRYYTSFAPFRVDFGFKIYDPADNRPLSAKKIWDEALQIHFGVGEAF